MTWDGDPRKSIALDDKEGLALYRKGVDFRTYTKQRKLEARGHPSHMHRSAAESIRAARRQSIERFEKQYPDFKEVYDKLEKEDAR